MNETNHTHHLSFGLCLLLLVGFAIITCLGGLGAGPTMGDHESIIGMSARETLQSGDWLIPQLMDQPRIRKTPLGIWLTCVASKIVDNPNDIPVSEISARLPSGIAGVLNALVVCWLGSMMFGKRAGLVAGFIAAGCAATIYFSHNAQVDMTLTLFTTLSLACFWRGAVHQPRSGAFMLLFYLAFAAAMMAKAPLPLATVGLTLAVYWFLTVPLIETADRRSANESQTFLGSTLAGLIEQIKRLPCLWLVTGTALFIIAAGAWPFYVYLQQDNALKLWAIEYLARYSGALSDEAEPFYYYIPLAFALTAPFLLSLPEALASVFLKRYHEHRKALAFALTGALVGTLFLSTAAFKRPHYLLSVIPSYCLLLAPVIDRLFFGDVDIRSPIVRLTSRISPILLGATFIAGGIALHRVYPTILPLYLVIGCVLWVMWSLAGWVYTDGHRTISFALLLSGLVVIVLIAWPALGPHLAGDPEVNDLVAHLQEHEIPTNADIIWVEGRPDSSIEFYSGYRVRRIIGEIEMADIRSDRTTVETNVLKAIVRNMREWLSKPQQVYLIISTGNVGLLERETDIKFRVLFELEGHHEMPGDEWAVITQPAAR